MSRLRAAGADGASHAHAAQLNVAYAEGLARYRERRFGEADRCFQHCLEIDPSDGAAHALRARIADFRLTPPGDDWDGVWHALGK